MNDIEDGRRRRRLSEAKDFTPVARFKGARLVWVDERLEYLPRGRRHAIVKLLRRAWGWIGRRKR